MGDDRLRRKKLIRQQLNWSDVLFKQIECTYIIQVVETGWNANANLTFIVKYFNEYIFIRFLLMNSIHFFFSFYWKSYIICCWTKISTSSFECQKIIQSETMANLQNCEYSLILYDLIRSQTKTTKWRKKKLQNRLSINENGYEIGFHAENHWTICMAFTFFSTEFCTSSHLFVISWCEL